MTENASKRPKDTVSALEGDDMSPTREQRLAAGEKPRRRAAFTETMQIGIVVRDLDATVRKYVEDYGIGPWNMSEFKPGDATEASLGNDSVLSGEFSGIKVAYLGTQRDLGVIVEVADGMPDAEPKPDAA